MKTRLTLKIRAGARKTEFAGKFGESWKLHVAAPPVDGKANKAIIRFLAELAGTTDLAVRIVSGLSSTTKIVEIAGVNSEAVHRAILESHGPPSNTGSAQTRKA
jgi:uncharacterized protein (TIGR00251 family)